VFERIWIFLHVATMFSAVAVMVIPEFVLHRLADRGDVRAVRSFLGVYGRLGKAVPVFFATGAILGLLAVYFNHLDFLAPWLIIAYVLFVIAFAMAGSIQGPWAARIGAAAAQSPEDQPSADFRAAAADPRAKYAGFAVVVIIVLIIFDMIFKPFTTVAPQF
jgi:hypothetical protein